MDAVDKRFSAQVLAAKILCERLKENYKFKYYESADYKKLIDSLKVQVDDFAAAQYYQNESSTPETKQRELKYLNKQGLSPDVTVDEMVQRMYKIDRRSYLSELFSKGKQLLVGDSANAEENKWKAATVSTNLVNAFLRQARLQGVNAYNGKTVKPLASHKDDLIYKFLPEAYQRQIDAALSSENLQSSRSAGYAQDAISSMAGEQYNQAMAEVQFKIEPVEIPKSEAHKMLIVDALVSTQGMNARERREILKSWAEAMREDVLKRHSELEASQKADSFKNVAEIVTREM